MDFVEEKLYCSGREIGLFHIETPASDTPAVFLLTGEEKGNTVWEETHALTDQAFNLVVVPVSDWETELSPWPAKRVFRGGADFGDGADSTARTLENEIVPNTLQTFRTPAAPCILAGYSLAGLFALYALYRTACFSGAVSASGSLWFPGFLDYATSNDFFKKPERVYLSVGDREKCTKKPIMQTVEDNTRAIYANFAQKGVDCTFQLNPGNHFQDAEKRLAGGIAWVLGC